MSYAIRDRSLDYYVTHRSTGYRDDVASGTLHLASARRINTSGDDAAGLAISDKLRVQSDGLGRASRNLQESVSVVQIAEGGIELLADTLQRIRVYAMQASTGTFDDEQRAMMQYEVDGLIAEIDRQVSTIQFNGKRLLDGSYGAGGTPIVVQIGAGTGQTVSIAIRSLSTESLGVDVLSGAGISTQAAAQSALDLLSEAISTVTNTRAQIGAVGSRLERALDFVGIARLDQTRAESKIRDLDISEGIVALQRVRTLEEAALSSVRRLGSVSDGVLSLLG